jgi:protoporphyrin/coproporphyrin ferrochelatase
VVLFNLGGPDSLDAVEPFLRNLFSDPAILPLPWLLRQWVAGMIARRRAPIARGIYKKLGGKSPILAETEAQAKALEAVLSRKGVNARVTVAMTAAGPSSMDAAKRIVEWNADQVVLLPLYPQFSNTTTASSFRMWRTAAKRIGLRVPTSWVCCYPWDDGFMQAEIGLVREALNSRIAGKGYRLLFSAHGLPEYVVRRGDPYAWQVARTAEAVVRGLREELLDWQLCFQSRVGPLRWLEPSTESAIRKAGAEGKGLIVVPIAFVSEHSETLVELDLEYGSLARLAGSPHYIRVPTVGVRDSFIEGLAGLVLKAAAAKGVVSCGEGRICPLSIRACGYARAA